MKKTLWVFICLLVGAGSAGAVSGIEIGVKGGIIDNYSQGGLSVSDYDINQLNMIGAQIYFSRLPMVDVILAGDYSWRNKTYTIAGQGFEFKMRDLAVTASVVYPVKLSVATPYVGGGIGTHSLSYEYIRPISLSLADNGIEIPETSTFFGYHGIFGAKINFPAFPLGFFVEGRLSRINAPAGDISFNSYAGGIYLSLP
jgi:opacity protein-like surface antigen